MLMESYSTILFVTLVNPIIRCKNPGETVPSPHDACNKCECSDDGTIGGCTKRLCFEGRF